MNVLLISLNREKYPVPVLPLGAAFLTAALERGGHRVEFLDLCFLEHPLETIGKAIKSKKPTVMCISIRNIDNESMFNPVSALGYIKQVIDGCKRLFTGKIMIGGAAFSLMPAELFRFLEPGDQVIGVIGEGEEPVNSILAHIHDDIQDDDYLKRQPYIVTSADPPGKKYRAFRSTVSLDYLLPARDYYDESYYSFQARGMTPRDSVQTRRGCSFSCDFCKCPGIEGENIRLRNIDLVVEEIRWMIKKGVKDFFFADNHFNHPLDYSKELCAALIKHNLKINWMCYLSPGNIDRQLAGLMKEAGCAAVYSGTDHLSDKMLHNLGKGFNVDDVIKSDEICTAVGLKTIHFILFGGVGEDDRSISHCLANLNRLKATAIFFSIGIRLYPGTRLCERVYPGDADSLLHPIFYHSPQMNVNGTVRRILGYIEDHKQQRLLKCTFPAEAVLENQ